LVSLTQRWMGQRLRNTARFAVAFSVAVLYLELLVLLHPTMPVEDVLFQAHRFEWVRAGRYFFTEFTPGGYVFPYAIGLYVAALPFASLVHGTTGYMVLVRTVTAVADAAAGVLLYPMITRQTGDRLAGAIAVALFHLVPINFYLQRVGNLTSAFAQSLLFACVALIVLGFATPGRYGRIALLTVIAFTAMVSHANTIVMLVLVLAAIALTLWRFGRDNAPAGAGPVVLIVTAIAAAAAITLYYRRFGTIALAPLLPEGGHGSIASRFAAVPAQVMASYGWPVIALAMLGGIVIRHRRDRLTLTTWAWLATAGVIMLLHVLLAIELPFDLAAFPAIALLAALGASWLWRLGWEGQAVSILLLLASVAVGIRNWVAPLR